MSFMEQLSLPLQNQAHKRLQILHSPHYLFYHFLTAQLTVQLKQHM